MSDYIILLFIIFVANVGYLNGHCDADGYTDTKCINIEDCETLRELVTKRGKTPEEFDYLRKRICGFDGKTSKICCPNIIRECMTPDGVKGQCVDFRNCAYFVSLLMNSPSPQDTSLITRSRCSGPDSYVCCPLAPAPEPITPNSKDDFSEECPATALPPDSESGCCGQNENSDKITGGAAVNIDEFTWLALLEYRKRNTDTIVTNCGGALISGKYVVTAAHCANEGTNLLYTLTSVRLGEYDTENLGPDCVAVAGSDRDRDCTYGAVSIPVERIISHPGYKVSSNSWDDIALLRLARMATFNYFVKPICLPLANISNRSLEGLHLQVVGWGAVDKSKNSSPVKLVVSLPYVDINTCANRISRAKNRSSLWEGQICAGGEPGKDSCTGDSGGPLMVLNKDRFEMAGIVSYGGLPCGVIPGVYTNVYTYLDWIWSNMHE